jgi:LysR family transcriptional regulator (chromosome initiation inhibitor)
MIPASQLAALAAVAETGSFERAAARLAVTPPAVSQRIRALEEAAGGPLLLRERPVRPTALGRRLLRHAREVAALEAGLAADLGRTGGPVTAVVAVTADTLASFVMPALAACEGMLYELVIEDQDHAAELLRRGEVSAAITARGAPVAGCDAHRLGALRYRALCTPAFHARHFPRGVTVQALRAAPMLRFNPKDALQHDWMAAHAGAGGIEPPAHRIGDAAAFLAATRAGLGWGLNPDATSAPDRAAGRLVELIPGTPLYTPLDWQVSRAAASPLAPLTRALRRAARGAARGAGRTGAA